MRGGRAHFDVQTEAVKIAHQRAIAEGNKPLAEKIRKANPDLDAQLTATK